MAASTDLDYNSDSRSIDCKATFYFADDNVLEVTKDNHLIHIDILEEIQAEDTSPISGVSSNELTITLDNDNGMFSPTNESSPYFGLMKKGVKIEISIRVDDKDSDPLGTFYITDWQATITGIEATVTANDKLYSVFSLPQVIMPISKQITYRDFIIKYFEALNIDVSVDASLTHKLKYAYATGQIKDFLTDLTIGAAAHCYCKHHGGIVVSAMYKSRPLRATLSEDDQLIQADATQSINTTYGGSEVICNTPQESVQQDLVNISNLTIQPGITRLPLTSIQQTPLLRLSGAAVQREKDVHIHRVQSTQDSVSVTLNNENTEAKTVDITVYGKVLEIVTTKFSDDTENMLSVDSKYIQDANYAEAYKAKLNKFVVNTLPSLDIIVRGNPLLELGDKVRVSSAKYSIDYTGVIVRANYVYDGSLSCTLTLLNASMLTESEVS